MTQNQELVIITKTYDLIFLLTGVDRDLHAETHRQVDRLLLARVLEYTRGNLRQAALLLGIARQTLRLKLRDLGLPVTRPAETDDDVST